MTSPVLCRTMDEAMVPLRRLAEAGEVVYDSETTGLDWKRDVIVGHVFTFGPYSSDSYYVPVRHGENHEGNILDYRGRLGHPFETELAKISASRRDLHWVGHHFLFDLMFLWGHGIPIVGTTEDTEVNAALLNEHANSYSLEECCIRMGTVAKKGEQLYEHLAAKFGGHPIRRDQMGNFWKLPGDDQIGFDYAAGDGTATWDLWKAQLRAIQAEEISEIHALEKRVTRVTYRIKRRGIKIDEARIPVVEELLHEEIKKARAVLPADFNPRAPSQVKQILTLAGHTDWPTLPPTKAMVKKGIHIGNPSFSEEWLKSNKVGQDILTVRKFEHLRNSFIVPIKERHLFNGRVHATLAQMAGDDFGTVTGRFSCYDPNLQQAPKRNKIVAQLFRSIFIPDEGMVWEDADLRQCEPRLLAHYSQCKVLLDGYLKIPEVDAHQSVTDAVLAIGVNIDREQGKRVNQTLLTGGGRGKIVRMLGERGEEIFDAYFRAMPEIRVLQKRASAVFRRRGYVKSLLGRRARLSNPNKDYTAINRLLQCGNADIIKKALADMDEYYESTGDHVHLLNTVHDSVAQQKPIDGVGDEIALNGLKMMCDFGPGPQHSVFLSVPMSVDLGRGSNWAEATFMKPQIQIDK